MPRINLRPGDIVLYLWNRNPQKGPINPPHCVWDTYRVISAAQRLTWRNRNDVMHIGIVVGSRPQKPDQKLYTQYLVAHSLAGKGTRITPLERDHPIIVLRPTNSLLAEQAGHTAKMFCISKRVGELQKSYLSYLSYLLYLSFLNVKASASAMFGLVSNDAPVSSTPDKEPDPEDPFIFYSTTKAVLSLFFPMFCNSAPSLDGIKSEVDDIVFGDREVAWQCSEFVVKVLRLSAYLVGLDPTHIANTTHIISPHDLAEHLMGNPNYRVVKPGGTLGNIFMFTSYSVLSRRSDQVTAEKRKRDEVSIGSAHPMALRGSSKKLR